jgi:hypothetical protein
MQRSLMWFATAALFASVLSGHVSQGEFVGMTGPHGTKGPAGNRSATASPGGTPRHHRFEAITHAPSASDCPGDSANSDVFELQCESNSRND